MRTHADREARHDRCVQPTLFCFQSSTHVSCCSGRRSSGLRRCVTQGPVVLTADRPTSGDRSAPRDAFRSFGASLLHRSSVSDLSRRHLVTTRLRLALARLPRAIEVRSTAPSRERTGFPNPRRLRRPRTPSSRAFPIRGLGRPLPFSMLFASGSLPDPSRLPLAWFSPSRGSDDRHRSSTCAAFHTTHGRNHEPRSAGSSRRLEPRSAV